MKIRENMLDLEYKWQIERVDKPTHLALSMSDYLVLKEEILYEVNSDEDVFFENLSQPLHSYEGLVIVVSEHPNFKGPILLVAD